jgi:hypothetical protein
MYMAIPCTRLYKVVQHCTTLYNLVQGPKVDSSKNLQAISKTLQDL